MLAPAAVLAPAPAHVAAQRLATATATAGASGREGRHAAPRLGSRRTADLPVKGPGAGSSSRRRGPTATNGHASASGTSAVQRAIDIATASVVSSLPTVVVNGHDAPPTIRRFETGEGVEAAAAPHTDATPDTDGADAGGDRLSTTAVLDRVDQMMAQLEERILEELERRGGRFTGSF